MAISLTLRQFKALCQLLGMLPDTPSTKGARLILVEGMDINKAAQQIRINLGSLQSLMSKIEHFYFVSLAIAGKEENPFRLDYPYMERHGKNVSSLKGYRDKLTSHIKDMQSLNSQVHREIKKIQRANQEQRIAVIPSK